MQACPFFVGLGRDYDHYVINHYAVTNNYYDISDQMLNFK